ncbi:MAG: M28 family peptidase [Bryobacterales bacterium]|nr:M28 family peptidase [Bryobacterales bacterium]
MKFLLVLCLAAAAAGAQPVSSERLRAHVQFLASDLLEGRGVGTRGGALTEEYLATQFALAGAEPAGENGTYFQAVPLVGVRTDGSPELTATAGGRTVTLRWLDDFAGVNRLQTPSETIDSGAVFAGHGIHAPEFGWDDYKGTDVRGKVVLLFTNEPESADPKFFGGRALTYYGRWTYKYEEATRRGARAVLLLHTTETASYGWDVVRNSWGSEDAMVRRAADTHDLALAGWVTQDAARRMLSLAGHDFEALWKASRERAFQPVALPLRIRGEVRSRIRDIESRNVVARVTGSDPELAGQAVIYSAHWDHLGLAESGDGDRIYNGAVDNATGCAVLLELARAWASLPLKPRRSALFLAVTAEENGLRGSDYYTRQPLVPPGQTVAALNYDALWPFGRTADIVVAGAERTTLWPLVRQVAERMTLAIAPDPRPEAGSYYRSDHFSFARAGIPAFSIRSGREFRGKPADFGDTVARDYVARHYHQPSDEYREDWDFSGIEELAVFGMRVGVEAANQKALSSWNPGDEFLPARERSLMAPSGAK